MLRYREETKITCKAHDNPEHGNHAHTIQVVRRPVSTRFHELRQSAVAPEKGESLDHQRQARFGWCRRRLLCTSFKQLVRRHLSHIGISVAHKQARPPLPAPSSRHRFFTRSVCDTWCMVRCVVAQCYIHKHVREKTKELQKLEKRKSPMLISTPPFRNRRKSKGLCRPRVTTQNCPTAATIINSLGVPNLFSTLFYLQCDGDPSVLS